jgi:hypothetical protein
MAGRRKKDKTQTEARNASGHEAIAMAAAAGALAIGVADAVASGARDVHSVEAAAVERTDPVAKQAGKNAAADGAPEAITEDAAAAALPVAAPVEVASAAIEMQPVPAPVAIDPQALGHYVAEQVSSGIAQAVAGMAEGQDPAVIGQTIASQIVESVSSLLTTGPAGAALSGMPDHALNGALDEPVVGELFGTTNQLAETVLANVDAMLDGVVPSAAEILADVGETVGSLTAIATAIPASLLGAEADGGSSGLLGALFYDDGASDAAPILLPAADMLPAMPATLSPAIAPMTEALVPDIVEVVSMPVELAGLSYAEATHGVYDGLQSTTNAFGLL